MSQESDDARSNRTRSGATQRPLVVRPSDNEFQRDVLIKLSLLEAMMEMLAGGRQPGRMKLVEDRVAALERTDAKRSVYDRLVNAAIATLVSAAIAMHDHFVK